MNTKVWLPALLCAAALATACEREGPAERMGEELDEAADTLKRGGDESTENKIDDAVDEARDVAEE